MCMTYDVILKELNISARRNTTTRISVAVCWVGKTWFILACRNAIMPSIERIRVLIVVDFAQLVAIKLHSKGKVKLSLCFLFK